MDTLMLQDFLMWCTILNYIALVIWFLAFIFAHDLMYNIHRKWFNLSVQEFDSIHYRGMAYYKIGVLLFNLVPFIALTIMK